MSNLLAVCMIVRDEEATLARCLESLAGLEARLYITDTGSKDRTREIARDYGAQLRNFPWVNDFSAARNHAISGVAEDWILNLDADDYFAENEAARIPPHLQGTPKVAFALPYEVEENCTPARSLKIFRNHLGIHFEGIIHEYFRNSLSRFQQDAIGEIPVLLKHSGYSEQTVERKALRNLPLLQREWERCCSVSDWSQMQYIGKKLAEIHFLRGESAEAEKLLRGLLDLMSDRKERHHSDWQVTLLTHLIGHYHERGLDAEAEACCALYEPVFGQHPLFALYRGITRLRRQDFPGALADFDRFEASIPRIAGLAVPRTLLGPELWNYQGICLSALDKHTEATAKFSRAAAADPRNAEYQSRLKISTLSSQNGNTLDQQTIA